MTLEQAKYRAEMVLRQAGYTDVVEWSDIGLHSVARCVPVERVTVYANTRYEDPIIEVIFEGRIYSPLDGPAHRAATVAMLAEVLHPAAATTDQQPSAPPRYSKPDLSHYMDEVIVHWLKQALQRGADCSHRVQELATELGRRSAEAAIRAKEAALAQAIVDAAGQSGGADVSAERTEPRPLDDEQLTHLSRLAANTHGSFLGEILDEVLTINNWLIAQRNRRKEDAR